jgi:hypothetical protein
MNDTAIALLGALLANPSVLKNRMSEFSAVQSAALAAEQRLEVTQSEFVSHKETVAADLQRLERSVTARRERVEGAEGLNESNRSRHAEFDAEWRDIGMPSEVNHG